MFSKFFKYLSVHGLLNTLHYLFARFKFIFTPPESVREARVRLSGALSNELNNTVTAGLFKGMVLLPATTWGSGDRACQLLGFYEQEIQDLIKACSADCDYFIDVGAADGYYAIGTIFKNLFQRCYAFEVSFDSRRSISQLATLNGTFDRIEIHGLCDSDSLLALPLNCRSRSFILVDIEGGEFSLLTAEVIEAFSRSVFVIELHPWVDHYPKNPVGELCERLSFSHDISFVRQGARDPNQFDFLHHLPDNERWLLVSENRGQLMQWLFAYPRQVCS